MEVSLVKNNGENVGDMQLKTPVDERVRAKGDAGRCTKQTSKRRDAKQRNAPRRRTKTEDEPMLLTKVKAIRQPRCER